MLTFTDGNATSLNLGDIDVTNGDALGAPSDSATGTKYVLMENSAGLNVTPHNFYGTAYAKHVKHTDNYEYIYGTENHTTNDTRFVLTCYYFANHTADDFTSGTAAEAWGGRSLGRYTVENNKLTVMGGSITNAYGGLSEDFINNFLQSGAGALNNTLNLKGGTIVNAYGGKTTLGISYNAENNTLTLDGASVQTLTGGMGYAASDNKVYVKSGSVSNGAIGGYANDWASRNAVYVESSITGNVIGSFAGNYARNSLVRLSGGTVTGDVIGSSAGNDAYNSLVRLSGGTVTGDVYGGFARNATGTARGNDVTVDAPASAPAVVTGTIYGGNKGAAGNELNIKGSVTTTNIKNFSRVNFTLGTAGETMLRLTDGSQTAFDWESGLSFDTSHAVASATGISTWTLVNSANTLTFNNYDEAKKITDTLEYSIDKSVDGKRLIAKGYQHSGNDGGKVESGTYAKAWGGISQSGHDVQKNKLSISGTGIVENAYGGVSYDASNQPAGTASENSATLSGTASVENLAGGYALKAEKNSVVVESGTVVSSIVGGHAAANEAKTNQVTLKGGTLGTAMTPISVTGGLVDGADGDASGNEVSVANTAVYGNIIGGQAAKTTNDNIVSLTGATVHGTITSDAELKNEVTLKRGVARRYEVGLMKTAAGDEIRGKVTKVSISEQSKSPVETRAAESALIASGGDLLADAGMASAIKSAAGAGGSFDTWASQSGSSLRLKSGSYVDSKGYGLNVGFARANKVASGTLTFGPFVEYGRGSYDSYLDDGTHGDGKMRYIGGGVMAKLAQKSGGYVEGSIRAGKARSDYHGNVDGNNTTYKSSNSYYGMHLGAGHAFNLRKGDVLDGYVKYFYTHQGATTETIYTNGIGERAHFDAVNSQCLRLGARYSHKDSAMGEAYAGLAYEYEFGGKACATFGEDTAPSPSLKGSSYMLEVGYRFAPKASRLSYGLNLSGWQGKRRGVTGGLQVAWGF